MLQLPFFLFPLSTPCIWAWDTILNSTSTQYWHYSELNLDIGNSLEGRRGVTKQTEIKYFHSIRLHKNPGLTAVAVELKWKFHSTLNSPIRTITRFGIIANTVVCLSQESSSRETQEERKMMMCTLSLPTHPWISTVLISRLNNIRALYYYPHFHKVSRGGWLVGIDDFDGV